MAASARPRGSGITRVRPGAADEILKSEALRHSVTNRNLPSRDHSTMHGPLHRTRRVPYRSETAYVSGRFDGSTKPDATAHSPSGDVPVFAAIGNSVIRSKPVPSVWMRAR